MPTTALLSQQIAALQLQMQAQQDKNDQLQRQLDDEKKRGDTARPSARAQGFGATSVQVQANMMAMAMSAAQAQLKQHDVVGPKMAATGWPKIQEESEKKIAAGKFVDPDKVFHANQESIETQAARRLGKVSRKVGENTTLVFDGDKAGQAATD